LKGVEGHLTLFGIIRNLELTELCVHCRNILWSVHQKYIVVCTLEVYCGVHIVEVYSSV